MKREIGFPDVTKVEKEGKGEEELRRVHKELEGEVLARMGLLIVFLRKRDRQTGRDFESHYWS